MLLFITKFLISMIINRAAPDAAKMPRFKGHISPAFKRALIYGIIRFRRYYVTCIPDIPNARTRRAARMRNDTGCDLPAL